MSMVPDGLLRADRKDVRFALLLVLAGVAGGACGLLAGRESARRANEEGARAAEREGERARRHAAASSAWLAGRDRTFALMLRRPHLELVDALMRATPPPPDGADERLAEGHDAWALVRRDLGDVVGAAQLSTIARRLDPDATRARIRELLVDEDVVALRDLAPDDAAEWPAATALLHARALAALGVREFALRALERAIREHPSDLELRLAAADLLRRGGPPDSDRARDHLAAAEAIAPGSIRAAVWHGWHLFDTAGDASEAISRLRSAERRLPREAVVPYALGCALFKARHVEEARTTLRRALDLDPAFALAQAAIGETWLDEGRRGLAVEALRESLAMLDTPDARDALASALWRPGDEREARELLEESVQRHPRDALLRDHLAGALVLVGRHAEAMDHLREAVRLDEWIAEVQNDFAWELVNSGDPALRRPGQALAHTLRACELEPDNSWYLNTLGATWYRLGEHERAAAELERACRLPRGGGPYDLLFLAMAYERLGDHARALERFASALTLMDDGIAELVRLRDEAIEVLGPDAVAKTPSGGERERDGS